MLSNSPTDVDAIRYRNCILVRQLTPRIIFSKIFKKWQQCTNINAYTGGAKPLIPLSFIFFISFFKKFKNWQHCILIISALLLIYGTSCEPNLMHFGMWTTFWLRKWIQVSFFQKYQKVKKWQHCIQTFNFQLCHWLMARCRVKDASQNAQNVLTCSSWMGPPMYEKKLKKEFFSKKKILMVRSRFFINFSRLSIDCVNYYRCVAILWSNFNEKNLWIRQGSNL